MKRKVTRHGGRRRRQFSVCVPATLLAWERGKVCPTVPQSAGGRAIGTHSVHLMCAGLRAAAAALRERGVRCGCDLTDSEGVLTVGETFLFS